MFKKITFVGLSALLLTGCSANTAPASPDPVIQIEANPQILTDVSLWTNPTTLQGGEGLSFMLPDALTYAGGGDTDTSSVSWVTEKESGEVYFSLKSYALVKCADESDCNLGNLVPATPEEVMNDLLQNPPDGCTPAGEVEVGNVKGQAVDCQASAVDSVFFYGSEGTYSVSNNLGDELFHTFLSTFKVE